MKIRKRKDPENREPVDSNQEMVRDALFETIRTQIRTNDPPETASTLDRLLGDGHSEEEAMRLIGCALSVEVFEVMKHGRPFDPARYRRNLERLPTMPS